MMLQHMQENIAVRDRHIEWPDLERYSDIPLFNTKAVVQQTGVAAPTLRAWERRYMLLSPERANNDYRLYSERDIAVIRWLKERVDAGMSISQAIVLFRHLEEEHRQLRQAPGYSPPSESTSVFLPALPTSPVTEQEVPSETGRQLEEEVAPEVSTQPVSENQNIEQANVEKASGIYPSIQAMRVVQERLMAAFRAFDEAAAHELMASVLAIYPLEQVCAELITPTLWEVGEKWRHGQITVSVEHFASNFFRGLLTNLLHVTPSYNSRPVVIACCAPGEAHELAPLMLALLLRRAGLQVIYLGQSIETPGLLRAIRQLAPVLVCVSVSGIAFLEALIDLGKRVEELPAPRPRFIFGGQIFAGHPELISQVPGVYVDGDVKRIVGRLREMAFERVEGRE